MRILILNLLRWVLASPLLRTYPRMPRLRRRLELAHLYRTDIVQYRVEMARQMGARIGKGCRLFSLHFFSEPGLVELGDNVIVSGDVTFLTHDGAILTFEREIPDVVGHYGRITVGDNTFIGFGAIILPNVSIGKNCIIAAGAVVMDSFPDDVVIGGNPARVMFTRSVYLAMKRTSPFTVVDGRYLYPRKYPLEDLYERIRALPVRGPRAARPALKRNG